ncbi:RluA family pseudouridine synthase [Haloferula sargassicola]|uniref:Pseudouridine synthase n=1 Tax=Haloferula sargassicola TaxID=490096 RepID=A0ABP9UK37_9BACT
MEIEVDGEPGSRLDAFLASRLDDLSRSRIQALIRDQHIRRNGQPAKPRDAVALGDRIQIDLPEAVPAEAQPEEIPLAVLYEDDDLLVLDKAEGMVVHPAAGNPDGTLVNALLHHCRGRLSGIGGVERPGIVHRLDKDTSGCLVVAKTDTAHRSLVDQFAGRTTSKRYLAVVQGTPPAEGDTVFTHIARHPVNRMKMAVVTPPAGKPSITDYRVLSHDPATGSSLVLCDLHTGRTHQIRVHMLHLGCPLIGDPIYGKPARQKAQPGRMMLHAWQLEFDHPADGRRMKFEAPIPPEYTPWLQLAPENLL